MKNIFGGKKTNSAILALNFRGTKTIFGRCFSGGLKLGVGEAVKLRFNGVSIQIFGLLRNSSEWLLGPEKSLPRRARFFPMLRLPLRNRWNPTDSAKLR
jgi:hypothetical protein